MSKHEIKIPSIKSIRVFRPVKHSRYLPEDNTHKLMIVQIIWFLPTEYLIVKQTTYSSSSDISIQPLAHYMNSFINHRRIQLR